jgi:hypothetical protein
MNRWNPTMIFCLESNASQRHLPVVPHSDAVVRESYTARALALSCGKTLANDRSCRPGSRADFIRALEVLGKRLTKQEYHFKLHERAIEDEQVALRRCPYATWVGVFGPPKNINEPSMPSPLFPVQVWRYDCTDGPVECVGHQVNGLDGRHWVSFVRLCYF